MVPGTDSSTPSAPKPRQRSSIACTLCHSRRVKCDAAVKGGPCSNCETSGLGQECRLIESQRGRKRKLDTSTSSTTSAPTQKNKTHEVVSTSPVSRFPGLEREEVSGTNYSPSLDKPRDNAEGPEMLYASMLDTTTNTTKGRKLLRPGGQVIYLGETFNLTYLLQQTGSDTQHAAHKMHFALPTSLENKPSNRPKELDAVTIELLNQQNAFAVPSVEICHELFRTYFRCVQPHYPILDSNEFALGFADMKNPTSWLLLQAVLFMAAGHCETSLLKAAGFKSRSEARLILFKRTKALYDADYEADKVTIVQALFLMSFWWASPMDQKDTWHWLGNAISLALTLGMHRSTRLSDMNQRDQRLWKRIWWSLFTEDKHAAAALGRPVHIHLRDTDVEPLEEADFDEGEFSGPHAFGLQQKVHVLYAVHLSKLSVILERIIEKAPNLSSGNHANNNTLELCEDLLQKWALHLPQELLLSTSRSEECLWTNMLHIAYSWFRILTHRTRTPTDPSTPPRHLSHEVAMSASNQIVRIVEDLLASNRIQDCPIHIIPSLFAAMCMQAVNIQSSDKILQQLAYVRLRLCMIALRELQSSWPVSGWIFLLFTRIVRQIHDEDGNSNHDLPSALPGDTSKPGSLNPTSGRLENRDPQSITSENSNYVENIRHPNPVTSFPSNPRNNNFNGYTPWEPQSLQMPLNFSTDWSGICDEDLWLVNDLDAMGNMTRIDNSAPYSSHLNLS